MAGRSRTFSSSSPALSHPVQVKTLLRWVNHHLRRSGYTVEHMEELRNGVVLIRLIESAAEVTLECKDPARSRSDNIFNLRNAIDFLVKERFNSSECDFEALQRGDKRILHTLIYSLACRYHIRLATGMAVLKARQTLLEWVRESIRDETNMTISGLDSGFQDGWALASLVHHFKPHLLQLSSVEEDDPLTRTEKAVAAAHSAGVLHLIDPDDLVPSEDGNPMSIVPAVDRFSLLMYLSEMRCVLQSPTQVSDLFITLSPVRLQPPVPIASTPPQGYRSTPVLNSIQSPSPASQKPHFFKTAVNIRPAKQESPPVQLEMTTRSPVKVTHASVVTRDKAMMPSVLERLSLSFSKGSDNLMQLLFREVESLEKERDDALQLAQTLSSALTDGPQANGVGGETEPVDYEERMRDVQEEYNTRIEQLEKQLSHLVSENMKQKRCLEEKERQIRALKEELKDRSVSSSP